MTEYNTNFWRFNADLAHQHLAGIASWAAFSARWRARQGLPLLHPLDVQYLIPQDFCNQYGRPLPPTEQRRLFRCYIEAAMRVGASLEAVGRRRALPISGDIAYMRAAGCVRSGQFRQGFVYGREDIGRYEDEAFCPARPYGIPVTSPAFQPYWLAMSAEGDEDENGDESWIAGYGGNEDATGTGVPDAVGEGWVPVLSDERW
jgi:hypothetical protein